jgi:DNA repair photolyase
MYEWVTHMHSHLRGECPHGCEYCYVQAHERRWKSGAFKGALRLKRDELAVKYGSGKVIFVEHQNDLFADGVPMGWVLEILEHCRAWPDNEYVFQTKNPGRLLRTFMAYMPADCVVGTTIETNMMYPCMGRAPRIWQRAWAMGKLRMLHPRMRLFVTIEPILAFDLEEMVKIATFKPDFVNIGADSKGHGLPEPTRAEVLALVKALEERGVKVNRKSNLERLVGA